MTKVIQNFLSFLILATLIFVPLFDPTEMALGIKLWPAVPAVLVGIAEFVGNLFWIIGLFAIVVVGVGLLVYIMTDNFDKTVLRSLLAYESQHVEEDLQAVRPEDLRDKEGNPLVEDLSHPLKKYVHIPFTFMLYFFILGSGFWFTGAALLLVSIFGHALRSAKKEKAKEAIKSFIAKNPTERAVARGAARISDSISGIIKKAQRGGRIEDGDWYEV